MKKIIASLGIIVVLVIIALGVLLIPHVLQAPVPQTSPILGGKAVSSQGERYIYNVDTQYYTIETTYPSQIPLAGAAGPKAERVMEQAIADDIAQFKSDSNLDQITPQDAQIQGLDGTRKYAFNASYTEYESTSTISYVFTIYQDTLGAHPNTFFQTFTFDRGGNQLQLADLFKANSNYLQVLSPLAYSSVVAQLKLKGVDPDDTILETVRMGTEASPEALQFFYINEDKLHLLFPPYQVAAYAAGSFDVEIPLSQLKDILK